MIKRGKVTVICDGQFGSTGKGLCAGYVAENYDGIDIVTTNASANAGHTTKWLDGREIVCYHLPTSGIIQKSSLIYLNAGSIIDVEVLLKEIMAYDVGNRLIIHPNATIIQSRHKEIEQDSSSSATKISSTQKGVGAALADKVKRSALLAKDHVALRPYVGRLNLNNNLASGDSILMEIPQGYSLSYNSPFYPYCTSRQCTPAQGLADAEINPHFLGDVIMTMRTYPIRVGSIEGQSSGGWYGDQKELDWSFFKDVEPERTTVTKRVRRIATFSMNQYHEALTEIRPDYLFLNFMNYMGRTDQHILDTDIRARYTGILKRLPLVLYGYGPNVEDVTETLR